MPFEREGANPLGHEQILKDPEVVALLRTCTYLADPEACIGDVVACVIDMTERVRPPSCGIVLACDGSSYEAAVRPGFPSTMVGFLKLGQVWLHVDEYRALAARSSNAFVDPIEAARIARENTAYTVALTGAGVSRGGMSYRSTFRQTVFEAFVSERFRGPAGTLLDTLADLCRRMGRLDRDPKGRDAVRVRRCPITGERLPDDVLIPVDPGRCPSPTVPGETLYLTDILRLSEAFSEEGSNQQCLTRAMNVIEHILLAHTLRSFRAASTGGAILERMIVLMDGPLAIFGEPAVFHVPIMDLLAELRAGWVDRERAPLVMGIVKSGPVVDHGRVIQPLLEERLGRSRLLVLPITDGYRYRHIDHGAKDPASNYGSRTHYGQSFLVRSRRGRMFELNLAYPQPRKDKDFQSRKVDLSAYGPDLERAISALDLLETDLFEDANIAQHLAHRCASIAHRPAGRTLDAFIRTLLEPTR